MLPTSTTSSNSHRRLAETLCWLGGLFLAGAPSGAQKAEPADASRIPPEEEVVVLSPFEVVAETRGYYSANTMSGTRFNTRLEDLASSITVLTAEQMSDFAMLDLNDAFLYIGGAEGAGTYTDFAVDRNGSVTDNVQLNPTQANRIRGLGAANISFGNYEMMGRVPIDPILIDSLEISRGPNANVFGLGNPAGTVNQVPVSANLRRNRIRTGFRADSYGGHRVSLDVNQAIIPRVLAVRASGVFQHESFERKPSGVDTERYNVMAKWRPFRRTTLSAAAWYYHSYGVRPNFTPPRDSISHWIASGKPTWDPVTRMVHVGGVELGPYNASSAGAYDGPDYFNRSFTGNNQSFLYIDTTGVGYFAVPRTTGNAASPESGAQPNGYLSPSAGPGVSGGAIPGQPLFVTTPSVTDKSLYDWSSINLASVNYNWDRVKTFSVQLDQIFLDTREQTLALQLGWLREDADRFRRNHMGIANDLGQSGQLLIDVNERLLDGTENPYFLRPYIGQNMPRTIYDPAAWDTYRAQLAYGLDLTQRRGALRWLGRHQLSAYGEYKQRISRRYSYREAILSNNPWIPKDRSRANNSAIAGGPAVAPNYTRSYLRYYVGDAEGNNVDYAPGELRAGPYDLVWGAAGGKFNYEPVYVGMAATTDGTGGTANSKIILKTIGAVVQSHLLQDRVVTSLGWRRDEQYSTTGNTPQLLNPDGYTFDFASLDAWQPGYQRIAGETAQIGVVARPFHGPWARSLRARAAFLSDLLDGLHLTWNHAESFLPQTPRDSINLDPLPNPSSTGQDYGFGLKLFDGKLILRFNHYETSERDKPDGTAGILGMRVARLDLTTPTQYALYQCAGDWVAALNPSWNDEQVRQEVARQMQLPLDFIDRQAESARSNRISAAQDVEARGNEIEIFLNPTKAWTISLSAAETRATNRNVAIDTARWLEQRLPVWTSIVDQRTGKLWWTSTDYGVYGTFRTPEEYYLAQIDTLFDVARQLEGKSNPQIRRYSAKLSTRLQLDGVTSLKVLKDFSLGGALRWEDKGAIGYYGVQQLPEKITDLDASRPIYDSDHFYVDAFIGYRMRLFSGKVRMNLQLNVRNLQEGGRLQPIGAYPDGTPHTYRIVDPRQFILQANFEL
ncbi:MAG: TonB-dependent receptor [Opitutaceae bacterium]|jgi:hypothetical protein|nr:TonB-dependent receptor [Opitutaceae bacterium]